MDSPRHLSASGELQAVRADVAEAVDADEPPRVVAGPPADAGDERVAAARRSSSRRASSGTPPRSGRGTIGASVPSTSSTIAARSGASARRVERGHGSYDTAVRLVLIGLVAGFFSALFGVGGGIVVVPLLILLARLPGAAGDGDVARGDRRDRGRRDDLVRGPRGRPLGYGLLLGLPAAVGAVAGTALQQRVAAPLLSYGFAALLAAVGIWLLV